jgi:hypothetical protein
MNGGLSRCRRGGKGHKGWETGRERKDGFERADEQVIEWEEEAGSR